MIDGSQNPPSKPEVKSKKCSKCSTIKPLEDFPPCKTGRYGRYNYCRPCHSEYQLQQHPERQRVDERTARRVGLKKQGLKTCTSCKMIHPLDFFYADLRHSDGKQCVCKECWKQKSNEGYLMREYGITLADFFKLLDAQDGVCAICSRPPKKNKFNVDHCHKTHRIRSLLCVNCNTNLLPYVEKFPEWIKRAFEYLESPPAFKVIGERMVPVTNQSRKRCGKPRGDRGKREKHYTGQMSTHE